MSPEHVHIVVVAFGHPRALDAALTALEGRFPVCVIDNSSSSEIQVVATRHRATYVDPGSNLGFAAGVNLGLRRLEGEPPGSVLLLNPDAIIRPDDVVALASRLAASPRLAAVSPRLLDRAGAEERAGWPFPSPIRAWLNAFALGRLTSTRTEFVIGAVLLLRWEAIREVGVFDERFFLYAEETDWQRRATNAGWRSELITDVTAEHRGAGTSDDVERREALFHAGQETYIRKWHGRSGWAVYRTAAGCGAAVRALLLRGERRSFARRRVLLYLRGPRRCAGLVNE